MVERRAATEHFMRLRASAASAAVFSTPFLQLDDSLQSKAVTKIWVYIVSSLIFTLITLISYVYWFPAGSHEDFSSNNGSTLGGQSSSAEDIKLHDLDDALLEPTPFVAPAMKDLESALKKILSSRYPINRGGSNTGGATDSPDEKVDATFDTPRSLTEGADLLQ
ncbi:cora-like mg2+ transporter domain-containing [Trichoderma arundinaceum]|uniref:Cora-like mg2+ transporter domain-containing n=1 Tax=Trichoderma arundinaceum TaxID=490622 RepID=A0A395NVB3_TRIAR|nr:cora-like mg2+ transporter domain-containing [Trichoderma arundinaceum]